MKQLVRPLAALFLVAALATPASARLGLQAGASIDPDDFLIGVHFKSHPIEESLFVVPSVEVGFGDITMIAGNLDLHYEFKTDSKWSPYAGGGLTINWFDFDGGSDTEVGGSLLGGVDLNERIYFEAKIGLGDVPDLKLLVGWHR